MKTTERTENILAGLELAVAEVVKPENLNRWMSVRQRSITGILKDCGVDYNFSSAFLEELRNVGLIETSSSGAGMKYMVRSCEIPDAAFLARKIYDNHRERYAKGRVNDGYPTSSRGDLTPKRVSKKICVGESGPVRVIPAEIAHLGDIGYILYDNEIKEVMVIGISYDTHDRRHVVYTVEMYRKGSVPEGEGDIYSVETTPRCKFYKTITDLVQNIHIQKYVKRK